MISLKKIIFEGVYDKITGQVVKEIFKELKKARKFYDQDKEEQYSKREKDGYFEEIIAKYEEPLKFYVSLRQKREEIESAEFMCNAYAYSSDELKDEGIAIIEIEIVIDPETEKLSYSTIGSYMQDFVRHEIEHLTQAGLNKKLGKAKPSLQKIRAKIEKEQDPYKYFILPDEVPAQVYGLYRKAKYDKKSLSDTMSEYLDIFVKNESITEEQKEIVLKIWTDFAKKNIRSAQLN